MINLSIIRHYFRLAGYLAFKGEYPYGWGSGKGIGKGRARTSGSRKVVFMCDGFKNHGGFTDRMRGILTTCFEARRRGLPFYISWTSPFDLSEFLVPADPSLCDWRIDPSQISYSYEDSFPVILDISSTPGKNIVKKWIFRYCFCGRRDVLVYSNMMYADAPELYRSLFKPSEYLQSHIDRHLEAIGCDFWSFTFRFGNCFGDFADIVGHPLEESEKMRLAEKNICELKRLLESLPDGFRALVTSDSLFFLNLVEKADPRIYVIKHKLMHVDYFKKEESCREVWLKSFLDQNLIMHARRVHVLRTEDMYRSSFPAFAAAVGGAEYVCHEF